MLLAVVALIKILTTPYRDCLHGCIIVAYMTSLDESSPQDMQVSKRSYQDPVKKS